MTEYSAIILAGGKSRRMGQKKGSLLFQGKTFIEIIVDKMKELGISDIIISGYDYGIDDTIYVEDIYPGKGPLAGIHAGLSASANDSVLVLTEDAPFVPVGFIRQLMDEHERKDSMVTAAECEGHLQQFPGIYEKKLASLCETILKSDRPTVRSLIEEKGCNRVIFDGDELIIRGCNTPEEYNESKESIC